MQKIHVLDKISASLVSLLSSRDIDSVYGVW